MTGRRTNTQGLNVRVDPVLRSDFSRAAQANGSDSAKAIRTLMRRYITAANVNAPCTCHARFVTHCPVHGP